MPACRQLGSEVVLGRRQTKLFEASALAHDQMLSADVGEGGAGPEIERVAEHPADRVGGGTPGAGRPGRDNRLLEAEGVHRVLGDLQHVPARARPQRVVRVGLPEDPPQP